MRICSSCAHRNADEVERCVDCGTLLDAPGASGLEPELRALVAKGLKLEAIKLCRARSGLGLREAKDMVERLTAGEPVGLPEGRPAGGGSLEAELIALLKAGRKIDAIKLHRERSGAGLKEAKEAVERLAARERIAAPPGGCLVLLATLFLR